MRLMGAVLLSLAGLLLGLGAVRELRADIRRREELCRMLEGMAFELERFHTPLPELFETLARQTGGAVNAFCHSICEGTSELGRVRFSELWSRGLETLPRREREILRPLGSVLGRYGTEQMLPAVESCRREMEQAKDAARARAEEKGRVYIGLCTAGGLMLAVMLL